MQRRRRVRHLIFSNSTLFATYSSTQPSHAYAGSRLLFGPCGFWVELSSWEVAHLLLHSTLTPSSWPVQRGWRLLCRPSCHPKGLLDNQNNNRRVAFGARQVCPFKAKHDAFYLLSSIVLLLFLAVFEGDPKFRLFVKSKFVPFLFS